jgi:hypothetical protein
MENADQAEHLELITNFENKVKLEIENFFLQHGLYMHQYFAS